MMPNAHRLDPMGGRERLSVALAISTPIWNAVTADNTGKLLTLRKLR